MLLTPTNLVNRGEKCKLKIQKRIKIFLFVICYYICGMENDFTKEWLQSKMKEHRHTSKTLSAEFEKLGVYINPATIRSHKSGTKPSDALWYVYKQILK